MESALRTRRETHAPWSQGLPARGVPFSSRLYSFRRLPSDHRSKATRKLSGPADQPRHACSIRVRFESVVLGFAYERENHGLRFLGAREIRPHNRKPIGK